MITPPVGVNPMLVSIDLPPLTAVTLAPLPDGRLPGGSADRSQVGARSIRTKGREIRSVVYSPIVIPSRSEGHAPPRATRHERWCRSTPPAEARESALVRSGSPTKQLAYAAALGR